MTDLELDRARVDEAMRLWGGSKDSLPVIVARLAREGWTPPVAVDPDEEAALALWDEYNKGEIEGLDELVLEAIKRGRALAAAEAQPGMVWVKHDGSNHCPVDPDSYVWIKRHAPLSVQTAILMAGAVGWPNVTHYAIITQPEEK